MDPAGRGADGRGQWSSGGSRQVAMGRPAGLGAPIPQIGHGAGLPVPSRGNTLTKNPFVTPPPAPRPSPPHQEHQ
ncbi:hypothetical protein GCM10010279_21030 [Streptomyces mutabilis]|nr:hypothetical protein GCM10010279_21030 [Streptomyces mutabilis]